MALNIKPILNVNGEAKIELALANGGLGKITHIALGRGLYHPTGTEAALADEVARAPIETVVPQDGFVEVTATITCPVDFTAGELAFLLEDGTPFSVHSEDPARQYPDLDPVTGAQRTNGDGAPKTRPGMALATLREGTEVPFRYVIDVNAYGPDKVTVTPTPLNEAYGAIATRVAILEDGPLLDDAPALKETPPDSGLVYLDGYQQPFDSGDGWWQYNRESVAATRTGYVVTAPGLPGRFTRACQAKGVFRPQDLGADTRGLKDAVPEFKDLMEAVETGDVIEVAGGRYLFDVEDAGILGTAWSQAVTGATLDYPDYIGLPIVGKRDIALRGDARIIHDRGAAFAMMLCDGVTISGLRIDTDRRAGQDTWYAVPADQNGLSWQASAVLAYYNADCTLRGMESRAHHRGIHLGRSTGQRVEHCRAVDPNYIGFANYGDLYQPAGWTVPDALTDVFDRVVHSTDTGVVFHGSSLRNIRQFGIYSNGPATVEGATIDRFADPDETGVTGMAGLVSSAGDTVLDGLRIKTPAWNAFRRAGPVSAVGISVKAEDIQDGKTVNIDMRRARIENMTVGVDLTECAAVDISDFHIHNYAAAAIDLTAGEGQSSLENIRITNTRIGNVDPLTKIIAASYPTGIGGVVLTGLGNYAADRITVEGVTFDQRVSQIQDAAARAVHDKAIHLPMKAGTYTSVRGNTYLPDSGHVRLYNNSVFVGRNVSGLDGILTEVAHQTTLPRLTSETAVYLYQGLANATVALPEKMQLGATITFLNRSGYALTIERPTAGHNIAGAAQYVLAGNGASVCMRCIKSSISSDAYSMEIG